MGRHSCCVKQKLRKGLWSPEEDEKLYNYITRFGVGCWSSVPKLAGLQRCGKSCRLRWINYLRPDLKRGMFSQQEEDLILRLHEVLGNRWAQIAAQLPGRTDNEIKNFWNSYLKKKLMKQGIDPITHQPLSENEVRDDDKSFLGDDKASFQIPFSNGLQHLSSSSAMEKTFQLTSASKKYCLGGEITGISRDQQSVNKQVFDPDLFLLGFQPSVDPCGYDDNFLSQCQYDGNVNFAFSSMPNLTNFDQRSTETDFSDSSNSRMSSFLINEAKESSSNSSNIISSQPAISIDNIAVENANAFSWDAENKYDLFDQQFNGIKIEDKKPRSWQERQLQTQNSGDFSNYPFTSLSQDLISGTSLDVFHQM
ncbi:hypothetical protein ACH5RR_025478 [Cinchona calisaya]|uniref:Uncharacterized protein n=1 Tax=Cinchona calisaya TaxID=153742 RepID=A0ABD2Z0A7_9GENT